MQVALGSLLPWRISKFLGFIKSIVCGTMDGLLRTRRTGPLESGSPPPSSLGDEGQGHEWVPQSCGSSPLRYGQHSFMLPIVWNVNIQHAPETHQKEYVTLFSLKRSLHFLLSIFFFFFTPIYNAKSLTKHNSNRKLQWAIFEYLVYLFIWYLLLLNMLLWEVVEISIQSSDSFEPKD